MWAAMITFAASLPGIFAATRKIAALNWLGNLSYPIYLVHLWVMMEMARSPLLLDALNGGFSGNALALVYLGLVAVAAVVAHYPIELPVGRAMRLVTAPLLNAREPHSSALADAADR
jgi:peptidoglycan/LPS O-acetylase OafA/YrhL